MANISSLSNLSMQQLNEMNNKAKRLVELMKQGIVEFIFKKKSDGSTRKANGTLKRDLIPPEFQRKKGRPKKRPEDLVIYYDVDKGDIRSFKDYLLRSYKKPKKEASSLKKEVNKSEENNKLSSTNKKLKDEKQDIKNEKR